MKPSYMGFYERYSILACAVFARDALLAPSRIRKVSLLNRLRDYAPLGTDPARLALHAKLNRHLLEAAAGWDAHDYGEGYFYQGCDAIGITGLRNTAARVAAMGLANEVAGASVLEVGCNTGFVTVSAAESARRVVGLDVNPLLVAVGRDAAAALGRENVELLVSPFEEFESEEAFDVVLSFANHMTYDQQTRQTVEEYFEKCRGLLRPGGKLLFESHPPVHEGDRLDDVCALIARLFDVEDRRVLDYGTFLDRGRTFVRARRRSP